MTLPPGADDNLIKNPGFEERASTAQPASYEISGKVRYRPTGYSDEITSLGIALDGFRGGEGTISQTVTLRKGLGKWVTFRLRGKAEDDFALSGDQLYLTMDFLSEGGNKQLETARRLIYREVLQDRKDLASNGNDGKNGAAVWRTYELEELLPFEEVDTVRVTLGFKGGAGTSEGYSCFYADDFSVTQSETSALGRRIPKATTQTPTAPVDESKLKALGGRWFYLPKPGETVGDRLTVNYENASRLYYKDGAWTTPFAGNMTTWLRVGHMDMNGQIVKRDRFLPDNVKVVFNGNGTMSIFSKNIPNHPTGKFPDTVGTQGYDPNYIMETSDVHTLPLEPKRRENPEALPANGTSNGALPMGPIGVAVNGVVFFNPFDGNMTDASRIMDRCCGHPAPNYQYHYHKYPICVNTPFVDKGEDHSPLLGFAFDGFPVYGPYESKGVMAKDSKENPIDGLNAHRDEMRGWHYHVTPGKFPYIIGGYMGTARRGRPGR